MAEAGAGGFLSVEGVAKAFGGVRAVDGVDLRLGPGEMRCIIGPNGCGKTTLFNLITGHVEPDRGSVRFLGRTVSGLPPHRVARAGIVRKFQVPSVFPELAVADNVATAARARPAGRGGPDAAALIGMVGLGGEATKPAGTLSHGQTQWLELAMVLATAPRLVLLDEPAAGMTRAEKARTLDLVAAMRRESGVAVLVIEHDMAFVEALGCEVSVMVMGRIVASGAFAALRGDPMVREAYLGNAHV